MQKSPLKLITIMFTIILIFSFLGCEKQSNCCTTIERHVRILYQNELGENLINSTSEFNSSDIRVYYKNGNDYEYIFNANLDAPNMHKVDEDENGNLILTVFLSNFYEGTQSTTLVELNPMVIDTIVGEFELNTNLEICKTAWLNGIEMNDRFLIVEK